VWGRRTAETLANSFVYTVDGQSHVVRGPCIESITMAFLDNPTAAPEGTCLENERPLQFLILPAGTRPLVSAALLVLGLGLAGITSYTVVRAWRRPQIVWGHNLRIVGWLPLAFSVLAVGLLLLVSQADQNLALFQRSRLIETIIPLAMAVQAAFLFAPDDEAPLELLLTSPRPVPWLLLERLLVVVVAQSLIAFVGAVVLVAIDGGDIGLALLRWIAPAALLTGLSLNAAIRSRKSIFGVISVAVIWFALGLFGEAFLPGQFVLWPLNYIQPVLWPLHIFLQPGDLLPRDYVLNRLFVLVLGLQLIALALAYVRDSERLLLGKPALKRVS
jgi:hypothetical protein